MFVRYKDYIGRLEYYELLTDGTGNVKIIIQLEDGSEIAGTCKESNITIPLILGNSHILYEFQKEKEQDKQKAEGE